MSGSADITSDIVTKVVVHIFDVAFVMVTALSYEPYVMFDKGIDITLCDEKPMKEEEEEGLAFLSFFFPQ